MIRLHRDEGRGIHGPGSPTRDCTWSAAGVLPPDCRSPQRRGRDFSDGAAMFRTEQPGRKARKRHPDTFSVRRIPLTDSVRGNYISVHGNHMKNIARKDLNPSALEAHLGYWLRRVSNHVSGTFTRALQAQQVSVAEWVVLSQIHEH